MTTNESIMIRFSSLSLIFRKGGDDFCNTVSSLLLSPNRFDLSYTHSIISVPPAVEALRIISLVWVCCLWKYWSIYTSFSWLCLGDWLKLVTMIIFILLYVFLLKLSKWLTGNQTSSDFTSKYSYIQIGSSQHMVSFFERLKTGISGINKKNAYQLDKKLTFLTGIS